MWHADFPANRGDVDDASFLAASHFRQHCHGCKIWTPEMGVDRCPQIVNVHGFKWPDTDGSRIIDEDFYGSQVATHLVERGIGFFPHCDIGFDREYLVTVAAE